MSRIGKIPITIPDGVKVEIKDRHIIVTGSKGTLEMNHHENVIVKQNDNSITVTPIDQEKISRSVYGLTRTLVDNMVIGVSKGFEKKLEINGVGYRAQMKGKKIVFNLGYSHPIEVDPPEGLTVKVEENIVTVSGINKQDVGDLAAKIRSFRKPEPYKGKGIRYVGEYVPRKEGKKVAASS